MNYRTPSYGGWLSLVFTLVLSSISGVADIAFQIKRLPIQPEQEGASVGDFHINGPGNVLWVEGVPSNGSTFTYNIYRPTGAPNPIDDVQRIPGPVSEPGGILGFNDTDNFIVNIPGLLNLDHRVYRWNGGSYVPLSDPNPLVQPPGRLLSSAGITGLANSGAALDCMTQEIVHIMESTRGV